MQTDGQHGIAKKLRRIANETAELPGIRWLAKPLYRRMFRRPYRDGNAYFGAYATYAQALEHAPQALPTSYDIATAGQMYRDRHDRIRVSDYPVVYWLSRLLSEGQRRVFDLGGHIGVSYYGFRGYLDYPTDLCWCVHDVPAIVATGRAWATEHDPQQHLHFSESADDADGQDVLISSGALQYLEYSLPELLQKLRTSPPHVLINLTPMHPSRSYFTLQNIGKAVLPYRVSSVPQFVAAMEALGYSVQDRWQSFERHLRVPFETACTLESYSGFYFRKP